MASVSVTAGQITRTYLLRGEGGKIFTLQVRRQVGVTNTHAPRSRDNAVQLSHNTVSGDRVIAIDGVEVVVG